MATKPTMEQLVRFQIERGDFGENFQFVDAVARGYVAVGDKVPAIQGPETYLRQTRDGKTLEVRTRPLPDEVVVTRLLRHDRLREGAARAGAQGGAAPRWSTTFPTGSGSRTPTAAHLLSNPAHQRQHGLREEDVVGKTAHGATVRSAGGANTGWLTARPWSLTPPWCTKTG
ncbi:MAG: hypothetical protein U1E71_05525 [Ramlibacter sp.]